MSINSSRRDLLRGATVTMTAASYSRVLGANDQVRLGLIGCGERGQHDMSLFQTNSQVEVVAVCDVYAAKTDQARSKAPKARDFKDHRALLDQKDLDVALIATPDHWHSTIAIDA